MEREEHSRTSMGNSKETGIYSTAGGRAKAGDADFQWKYIGSLIFSFRNRAMSQITHNRAEPHYYAESQSWGYSRLDPIIRLRRSQEKRRERPPNMAGERRPSDRIYRRDCHRGKEYARSRVVCNCSDDACIVKRSDGVTEARGSAALMQRR